MTSTVRIVLTNGRFIKRKIIGQRLSWLIVRRKHRNIYYPINQIRNLNYRKVEDFGFGGLETEASV
jgi:hypothetical protein